MEFLYKFNFKMKHVRGKESKVVDALSMKFHVPIISTCQTNLRARIFDTLRRDEMYLQVQEEI